MRACRPTEAERAEMRERKLKQELKRRIHTINAEFRREAREREDAAALRAMQDTYASTGEARMPAAALEHLTTC